MTTPRQSNQSVKYHRVGVLLPAKKKKGKDAVGKAFCFMHESAKATVDRKEGTRSSHLGTKSKVEESKRHMKGDRNKVSDGVDQARYQRSTSTQVQPKMQLVYNRTASTDTNSSAASVPSTVSVMRETLANAGTRATLVERNLMTDDVSINLNSYNGENKCDCIIEVKNKEDPPTTDDTVIQNLEDQIEQLNLTLAVFRTHQKQQTNEITNLRLGSANLRSQLIRQATSRAWYVSEYKNTRNQLIETNLSKMRNELSLAMEIIELKKKVTKLQGSREKAADILKRATKDSSLVEF